MPPFDVIGAHTCVPYERHLVIMYLNTFLHNISFLVFHTLCRVASDERTWNPSPRRNTATSAMSCCPPQTGLARLADDPVVVVLAYLAAFTPWGFLYAFDFISNKWKSIRSTRRAGYFHLCVAIIPFAYVCFYTHVQRVAGDYKEMSASITAAVFCTFHIARTLWGLFQLREFASWNMRTLTCLGNMGYPVEAPKDLIWRGFFSWRQNMPLSDIVHIGMIVNHSLVDNLFTGAELPVRLSFTNPCGTGFDVSLTCERPFECSVRWLTAFLCRFGAGWLQGITASNLESWDEFQMRGGAVTLQAFLNVTVRAKTAEVENGELYTLVSPGYGEALASDPFEYATLAQHMYSIDIEESTLPYNLFGAVSSAMVLSGLERFQYTLDEAKDGWDTSAWNHMSQGERKAVQGLSVLHLQHFLCLLNEQGKDWNTYRAQVELSSIFLRPENHKDAVSTWTVMSQLGYFRGDSLEEVLHRIPIKKDFFLSFLWEEQTNRCLLQASVHLDNYAALIGGFCGREGPHRYALHWQSSGVPQSIFEKHQKLECHLLENSKLEGFQTHIGLTRLPRKICCVMDTVRSFLAKWLVSTETSPALVCWDPAIEDLVFKFSLSRQLFDVIQVALPSTDLPPAMFSNPKRLIWECQYNLQLEIARSSPIHELQKSAFLMMLCVIGFPALLVSSPEDSEYQFHISPLNAPQDMHLQVSLIDKESRLFSIEIAKSEEVRTFRWQDWKDAAIGRLAGQSEWMQKNDGIPDKRLYLDTRPTQLSDPVIEIDRQNTGLSQNLRYWTGWPPFHPRFAGFEMDQFNLREEDLVMCQDMDEGTAVIDISTIDNAENVSFRKIESTLILIADAFKHHFSSSAEGNQREDHEQITPEESEIQTVG